MDKFYYWKYLNYFIVISIIKRIIGGIYLQYRFYKKISVFFIILLFIGVFDINLGRVDSIVISDNILYVGGSGPGNYSSIQDAINDASDGDTIYVYPGVYHISRPVIINKTIKLVGAKLEETIIESDIQNPLDLRSNSILIYNFTLRNICIILYNNLIPIDDIIIDHNIFIIDNYQQNMYSSSIINLEARNSTVSNNIIQFINYSEKKIPDIGVEIKGYRNIIHNNTVIDGCIGILLEDNRLYLSDNHIKGLNKVEYNILSNNRVGILVQPSLVYNYPSVITHNDFLKTRATFNYQIPPIIDILVDLLRGDPTGFIYPHIGCHWSKNYWYNHKTSLPKIILGRIDINGITGFIYFSIPCIAFDKQPSLEPNREETRI